MNNQMLRLYHEAREIYEDSIEKIISGKEALPNWQGRFYTVLNEGLNILKNDKPLYLSRDLECYYRSGLEPCLKKYYEDIPDTIHPISDISDWREREKAVNEVYTVITKICEKLVSLIDTEHYYMKEGEINDYLRAIDKSSLSLTGMNLSSQNKKMKKACEEIVSSKFLKKVTEWKDNMLNGIAEQRFDEYWAAHQPEKAQLESEKQSLEEQIIVKNTEISEIPGKTEGYSKMLELQTEVQTLKNEKKAIGFFKFKDKKAVQAKINVVENEIAPIQSRIDAAIEKVRKDISSAENRIKDIDTELTKPR
jgi:hypothetical protein